MSAIRTVWSSIQKAGQFAQKHKPSSLLARAKWKKNRFLVHATSRDTRHKVRKVWNATLGDDLKRDTADVALRWAGRKSPKVQRNLERYQDAQEIGAHSRAKKPFSRLSEPGHPLQKLGFAMGYGHRVVNRVKKYARSAQQVEGFAKAAWNAGMIYDALRKGKELPKRRSEAGKKSHAMRRMKAEWNKVTPGSKPALRTGPRRKRKR